MAGAGVQTVSGHITVVQEGRFLLVTDGGQALLLELGHAARMGPRGLRRLRDDLTPVVVQYEGAANMASGNARSVRPVPRNGNRQS